MKGKRLVATMLALLLVVSLLPMAAMAEPNTHERIEEEETYVYNEATNVTNYGTVTNNYADPRTSPAPSITPSIKDNNGTVVYNGGSSDSDKGTVVNNNSGGTVENNNPEGTVVNNYGLVGQKDADGNLITNGSSGNSGTVKNNMTGGIVTNNTGTVNNNSGLVTNNTGTVNNNESGGTVEINGGKIKTNNGTVGKKEDGQVVAGSGNNNAIDANCGTVISNNKNGTVGTNTADGKIEINNGTVTINGENATIGTNNGKVVSNYGTVETNAIDGVVNNYNPGEIAARSLDNGDAAAPEEKPNVDGVGTNFGTVVDKTSDTEKTYYGLSWGDSVEKLNSIESFVVSGDKRNLDEIASGVTRDGYKMTGYKAYERMDGKDSQITGDTTKYSMSAPVWLQILWKKIVKPASDEPEAKTVQNSIPTSLSADQVKVGAYVRRGNLLFRIIEVTDNDIRVATVGKLSEEDLADMLGCLKKHLSDAQIAKIIGEPALLEQELVTYFFGDSYEHIAFRAARDLFA